MQKFCIRVLKYIFFTPALIYYQTFTHNASLEYLCNFINSYCVDGNINFSVENCKIFNYIIYFLVQAPKSYSGNILGINLFIFKDLFHDLL